MARKKAPRTVVADEIQVFAAELTNDRVTAPRRREIASELVTLSNRVRRLR